MLGLWPSGWTWGVDQGHSHYTLMIIVMYAVLRLFLLLAARKPQAYSAIIWYTIWSSVLHDALMAVQAYIDPAERGHFLGDVPGLFIVAIVLGYLMPVTLISREGRPNLGSRGRNLNIQKTP
ncbi:DUF6632 domain-containing protein [Nitrosospira multiformis]|uniref:Uncharacterized protein n=1 Tax=Nitrosospira multiformis TaxID=1231 RepID=A0A1I7GW17_9PROT|nr:DUF6632 domain-containing protein [Nitrosospira multiformis]SFU52621.1 hypothetical protein SAMN05216417_10622 [Nitrosospira multiformis]